VCAIAVVAAGVATYANSLSRPLGFDDVATVQLNTQIRDLTDWRALLTPPREYPVGGRPLVNVTFALNYAVGGTNPFGYHVTNLALHLLCALLVFGLVRRTLLVIGGAWTSRATPAAWITALIWTVHPLNSEVVDYLSQRTNSMMTGAILLTLYAGVRAAAVSRPRSWLALGVAACTFGMACKETMVVAPILVLTYDRVFLFSSVRAMAPRRAYYAALGGTWAVLGVLLLQDARAPGNGFDTAITSTWTYLLNQAVVIPHYLRLIVWPDALVLYYGWVQPLTFGDVWLRALGLAGLLAVTAWAVVRHPRVGCLPAMAFLALSPSSSLVPIAAEVGAERRMYLPMVALTALGVIGWLVAVDWIARVRSEYGPRPIRRIAAAALTLATIALAGRTVARNTEFASGLTLARTMVERWPNPVAHESLGVELAMRGRHEEAAEELALAARTLAPAHFYLGRELYFLGRYGEALPELQRFVDAEPRLPEVRDARLFMARMHEAGGELDEAVDEYSAWLARTPDDLEVRLMRARVLLSEEHYTRVEAEFRELLEHDRNQAAAWFALGAALVGLRQYPAANGAFHRAIELEPDNARWRGALDQLTNAAFTLP
jgi:Flp pilus assembly protein TadD